MKNIFMKSMLRHPIKTALLMILIAVASFSFVMRSAEYMVINEKINEISGFFRAIGHLEYTGGAWMSADVRRAAETVSSSPYVAFDDRRRTVEAVLMDMANTDELISMRMVARTGLTPTDAFFYGTLTDIRRGGDTYMVLTVEVDSVLLGHFEVARAGQTLAVHYFMDVDEMQSGETAIDNMQIGGRYFLRGVFYPSWDAQESLSPILHLNRFVMHPISEITYGAWERYLPRDGVWFVSATLSEETDFAISGLEGLAAELHWIRYAQSKVRLQTTVDMTHMPLMQRSMGARAELVDGRWITYEDNEYQRPVVAVHDHFARRRGLGIGDTLSIGIAPQQRLSGGGIISADYSIIDVIGEAHAPLAHILELEIIGLFEFLGTPRYGVLGSQMATTFLYMPDSVLPPDVEIGEGFISHLWYSFVLNDTRDADAFLLDTRDALGAFGFAAHFIPNVEGARAFWESAAQILQSVSFNMVLFSIVAILVLALSSFLYLRQRQRDYAILRALGSPVKNTQRQIFAALIAFALPAIIVGGIAGWFVALSEAADALAPLSEVAYGTSLSIMWLMLLVTVVFAALIIMTLIGSLRMSRHPVLVMLQGETGAKTPAKTAVPSITAMPTQPTVAYQNMVADDSINPNAQTKGGATIEKSPGANSPKTAFRFSFINVQFILRHIVRQRAKTLLVSVIALFFVIALGFLQTAIDRTQQEIYHMYNTTLVTGEITPEDPFDTAMGRFVGNMIAGQTILSVGELVENEYVEAGHEFVALVAADEGGALPENWDELAGIDIDAFLMDNFPAFDPRLLGVNDLEGFLEKNSIGAGEDFRSSIWEQNKEISWVADWESYVYVALPGLQINFAGGFYPEAFVFTQGQPIPVIISNRIMGLRGFEHGDVIYIGVTTMRDSRTWNHIPAVIVGTHNRTIQTNTIIGGAVIPLAALQYIVGDELRYITYRFEIDPVFNREMSRIEEEIESIIQSRGAGEVPLRLILHDEQLRLVVAPMEQNLSLLRLLYPVAIALSAIIGLGLSMLLMLQNAKVAAIMRVLGMPRSNTSVTLCAEQMSVCLAGLVLGLVALTISGWGFGFSSSLLLAGIYFAGVLAGTICGAVLITNRPPLELLQVKE